MALQQLSTPLRRADLQHLCDTFIRKAVNKCSLILRESRAKVDVPPNISSTYGRTNKCKMAKPVANTPLHLPLEPHRPLPTLHTHKTPANPSPLPCSLLWLLNERCRLTLVFSLFQWSFACAFTNLFFSRSSSMGQEALKLPMKNASRALLPLLMKKLD